jgi:hypothetical protein
MKSPTAKMHKRLAFASLLAGIFCAQVPTAWAAPTPNSQLSPGAAAHILEVADPQTTPSAKHSTVAAGQVHIGRVVVTVPQAGDVTQQGPISAMEGSDPSTTFLTRDVDEGTQIAAVVSARRGLSDLRYTLPGTNLEAGPKGTIIVRDGRTNEPLALVEAPWAKDSQGTPLPTRYEIAGSTLTQIVSTTQATRFPVVADPRIRTAWYGYSVDFSYGETTTIAVVAGGCAIMAGAMPPPANMIMSINCGSLALVANEARKQDRCLSIKFNM